MDSTPNLVRLAISLCAFFGISTACTKQSTSTNRGSEPAAAPVAETSTTGAVANQLAIGELMMDHVSAALVTSGVAPEKVEAIATEVRGSGALILQTALRLGATPTTDLAAVAPGVIGAWIANVDVEGAALTEAERQAAIPVVVDGSFEFCGEQTGGTDEERTEMLATMSKSAAENTSNASLSEDGQVEAMGSVAGAAFAGMSKSGLSATSYTDAVRSLASSIGGAFGTTTLSEAKLSVALALASEKAGGALGGLGFTNPLEALSATTDGFVKGVINTNLSHDLRLSLASSVPEGVTASMPAWLPADQLRAGITATTKAGVDSFLTHSTGATAEQRSNYMGGMAGGAVKGLARANISNDYIKDQNLAGAPFESMIQSLGEAGSQSFDSATRLRILGGAMSSSITALGSGNGGMIEAVAPGLVSGAFAAATAGRASVGFVGTGETDVQNFYGGMFEGTFKGMAGLGTANGTTMAMILPNVVSNVMSAAVGSVSNVYTGTNNFSTNVMANLPAMAMQSMGDKLSVMLPPATLSTAFGAATSQYLYSSQAVVATLSPTTDFATMSKQISSQAFATYQGAMNADPAGMQDAATALAGRLGTFGAGFDAKNIAAVQGAAMGAVGNAVRERNGGTMAGCAVELPDSLSDADFTAKIQARPELVGCQVTSTCPTNRTTASIRFIWTLDPFGETCFLNREPIVAVAAGSSAPVCAAGTRFVYGTGCVPDQVSCASGQQFVYGIGCQESGYFCPAGQTFKAGSGCQPDATTYTCAAGMRWVPGSGCQPALTTCPYGTTLVAGVCSTNLAQSCPPGTTYQANGGGCLAPVAVTVGTATTCLAGFYRNPTDGNCLPMGTCPVASEHWDPATMSCKSGGTCATGFVWNQAQNACTVVAAAATVCAAGQYWSAAQSACLSFGQCPTGYYWDAAAISCRQSGTCPPNLPNWNPTLTVCEAAPVTTVCSACTGVPPTPASLTVTQGLEQLQISWTATTATNYLLVRRSIAGDGLFPVSGVPYAVNQMIGVSKVVSKGPYTNYTDTGLTAGTTYYYTVYSINIDGSGPLYSAAGATSSGIPQANSQAGTAPAAPTTFNANGTAGAINLSWDTTTASGFMIVRKMTTAPTTPPANGIAYPLNQALGDGMVIYSGTGVNSTFSDTTVTSGQTYFYALFAFNESSTGRKYSTSVVRSGVPFSGGGAPAMPTTFAVAGVSGGVNLSWTSSTAVTGYVIIRRASTAVVDLPMNGSTYFVGQPIGTGTVVGVGPLASLNFPDTVPNTATLYHYALLAYNGGAGGPFYSGARTGSATPMAGGTAPGQPTSLGVNATVGTLMLTWAPPTPAPTGYLVIRGLAGVVPSSTAIPVNGVPYAVSNYIGNGVVVYNGSNPMYTDSGLTAGQQQYYMVYALNGGAGGPFYSLGAAADGLPPSGGAPAQPSGVGITPAASSLSLGWNSNGAAGYLVLRASGNTSPSGVPVTGTTYAFGDTLGTGTVVYSGTTPWFMDSGLSAGQTQSYAIFAYNGGAGGPYYSSGFPISGVPSGSGAPSQPTGLSVTPSVSTLNLAWTGPAASGYLILRSSGTAPSATPTNGTSYSLNQGLGNAMVVGVVTSPLVFSESGLSAGVTQFYAVFAYNGGAGGPFYSPAAMINGIPTSASNPVWTHDDLVNSTSKYHRVVLDPTGTALFAVGGRIAASQMYNWCVRKYALDGTRDMGWDSISLNGNANGFDVANGVDVDSAGNVWVVGAVTRTMTNMDIGIARFNSGAAPLGTTIFQDGGINGMDQAAGVSLNTNGEAYVIGTVTTTGTYQKVWMRKFNSGGTAVWSPSPIDIDGMPNQADKGVAVRAVGNNSTGAVYFLSAAGGKSFLQKYNQSSNALATGSWVNWVSAAGFEARDMVVNAGGSAVYVVGQTIGTPQKMFVKKIDANTGAEIWSVVTMAQNSLDASAESVTLAADGRIIVAGWGTQLISGTSGKDLWLKAFDPTNGNEVVSWEKRRDISTKDDFGFGVVAEPAGAHVYAAGLVGFDPGFVDKEVFHIEKWPQ